MTTKKKDEEPQVAAAPVKVGLAKYLNHRTISPGVSVILKSRYRVEAHSMEEWDEMAESEKTRRIVP